MRSIYLHTHWARLQRNKESGDDVTFYFNHELGDIRYTFIKRFAGFADNREYFDLVTPRGYGGPYLENCSSDEFHHLIRQFDKAFQEYCCEENIVAEYIRFDPWINNAQSFAGIYDLKPHGFAYCNDLTVDFFNTEYSSRKRNNIRKAEKHGVEIEMDSSRESIAVFLELYEFTAVKHALSGYYHLSKDFLNEYFSMLPNKTLFANAVYKGRIISSALILLGEDIAHYHFAANHPEYSYLQGNSLLIYKASVYAKMLGKKLMDLGSAVPGSPLEVFKSSFVYKGTKYPVVVGTKIRNQHIYDSLIQQAGGLRQGYFPAYRQ
jgi:serine/alanine adding enzyme